MAKRFLTIANFVNLASDPESGSAGQLYFNTASNEFRYHDGESWKSFAVGELEVYDGGTPTTFAFNNNLDGGNANETLFIGIYDGGSV